MTKRSQTAQAISRLMPMIIQGAHLGVLSSRRMTQTQFLVMISVHAHGPCGMSQMARNMKVSMPTMSGVVDRLVEAKYLNRLPQADDRRQVQIELTRKGEQFLKEFQGIIAKRWEQVLTALDEKEVEQFCHIVTKLTAKLGDRK